MLVSDATVFGALILVLIHQLVELEEDGVRIALTIVDTPGFGDNIDNEFAYVKVLNYSICQI